MQGLRSLSLVKIAMSPLTLLKIVVRPLSAAHMSVVSHDKTRLTADDPV